MMICKTAIMYYYVPNQQLRNIIYIDRLIVKSYVKTDGIRNLS